MIKYLGSKRRLVPLLGEMLAASGAATALDLFTGTTRVAQEFKRRGARVTAVDTARYSEVFGQCYLETDRSAIDPAELQRALDHLASLPGEAGYVTEVFCRRSRFFQPFNGERIDAIRAGIDRDFAESPLRPLLLTSLIEAADRVDSTTGLQMAYVKQWAARSSKPLELRAPVLLDGTGAVMRGDACEVVARRGPDALGGFDLAYIDPPYNQHRYFTNYHVWETLVAADEPEHYGVACKRVDARDPETKSVFNRRATMASALRQVVHDVDARTVVVSYNDESWLDLGELEEICSGRGEVISLAFDSKRYVGAQIGIHNPQGEKVGAVSRLRNLEYVVVAGDPATVGALDAIGVADDRYVAPVPGVR